MRLSFCSFSERIERQETITNSVKPVLSGHLKLDKTMVLMENGSLMKVEIITEFSPLEHPAILLTCIKRY